LFDILPAISPGKSHGCLSVWRVVTLGRIRRWLYGELMEGHHLPYMTHMQLRGSHTNSDVIY